MDTGRLSRAIHTLIYRSHNGAIEALLLLAKFGETIKRANGFDAACALFANRSCIGNYCLHDNSPDRSAQSIELAN